MRSFGLVVVLLVGGVLASAGQDGGVQRLPTISLVLPSGVTSEAVQINYFMSGSFGGYGGFVRAEKNRVTYDIAASLDGKAAANIKVIAYLPGCEIVTLDIPVQGTTLERQLPCKPLGWTWLHGQISPASITKEQPTEVEVSYLATWDHSCFGISDGMVTSILLGTVVPDENGAFEVKLPDLYEQAMARDGEFQFTLRHATSRNIVAFLNPVETDTDSQWLSVRPSYAHVVQFMAKRQ